MRGDEEGLLTDITLNILGTFPVVKKTPNPTGFSSARIEASVGLMSKCTMKVCAEDSENGLECP